MGFCIFLLVISIIVNICLGISSNNNFNTILDRNKEIRELNEKNKALKDDVKKYKIFYENKQNEQLNSKHLEDKYYKICADYIELKSHQDTIGEKYQELIHEIHKPRLIPKYLIVPHTDRYNQVFQQERGEKAQSGKIHLIELQGAMYSEYSKKKYTTSFVKCDCEDFIFQSRKNPDHICKHMVAFALEMKKLEADLSHPIKNIESFTNEKK